MKKEYLILAAIFIVIFHFRLMFILQTPTFSSDSAYYNIRQTQYITENKFKPMIFDDKSYNGRFILDSHLFHYFLATLNTVLPETFVFKIIPELLFSTLVLVVYVLAKKISESTTAALFASFLSGFVPITVLESLNNVSIYSLLFPLMFLQVYFLFNLKENKNKFIILSFILPILSPISFLLSVAIIIYLILLNLESKKVKKSTGEALLFYLLISLLISLIIYKKAFVSSGLFAVWQNLPKGLLAEYFKSVNILELIYNIGFIPVIFGITGLFIGIMHKKSRETYFLSSIIIACLILLALKLISFQTGVVILGILLTIVSAIAIEKFITYINITKFSKHKYLIFFFAVIIVTLTLVIPAYYSGKTVIKNALTNNEVTALTWIKKNTEQDSTILANIDEGHYITAIANRKNVADTKYLLAPDKYSEVKEMFKTESLVKALQLMKKNNVDYVYMSKRSKGREGITGLKYYDKQCLKTVYENEDAQIYKVLC